MNMSGCHTDHNCRHTKIMYVYCAAVCSTCHALVHAGLLRVGGLAPDTLSWLPVAIADSLAREVDAERSVADRLPVVQFESRSARARSADAD